MNKKYNGCSVDDCDTKHYMKSFCIKHFQQVRTWGHVVSAEEKLEHYRARRRSPLAGATFKKGHTPWNKGKKAPLSECITPENHLERARFQKTMQKLIFIRDNFTCQFCGHYGRPLQVDHIKGWKDYPELRFEESNCRTLCMACHYYVTFKRKIPEGIVWGHNFSRKAI